MLWFWLNMPLAAAFFAAWVGVPLWLVLKHPDPGAAPVTGQARPRALPAGAAEADVAAIPQSAGDLAGVV